MRYKQLCEWLEQDTARMEAEQKQIDARREEKTEIEWWEWIIMFPFAVGIVILLAGFMSMIYRGI